MRTLERAQLTKSYELYLASRDVDITLEPGTVFTLYAMVRGNFLGVYEHEEYGDLLVDTPDAIVVR
jgi:hypothetical protein